MRSDVIIDKVCGEKERDVPRKFGVCGRISLQPWRLNLSPHNWRPF